MRTFSPSPVWSPPVVRISLSNSCVQDAPTQLTAAKTDHGFNFCELLPTQRAFTA
jgi:hypothetical protein